MIHDLIEQNSGDVKFEVADARSLPLLESNDLVLCLYDVIGSSSEVGDAKKVIQGLFRLCKPGCPVVIGCMNGLQMARRLDSRCMVNGEPRLSDMQPLSAMQLAREAIAARSMSRK